MQEHNAHIHDNLYKSAKIKSVTEFSIGNYNSYMNILFTTECTYYMLGMT